MISKKTIASIEPGVRTLVERLPAPNFKSSRNRTKLPLPSYEEIVDLSERDRVGFEQKKTELRGTSSSTRRFGGALYLDGMPAHDTILRKDLTLEEGRFWKVVDGR